MMQTSESLVPLLVGFAVLLGFHELGHYVVAKLCRVRIQTVSLGFGPELLGVTDRIGTRWRIAVLPFGAYVKMAAKISENDSRATGYDERSAWVKSAIMAAGPAANFLLTLIAFIVLFLTVGERCGDTQVTNVAPGSVAAQLGIYPGDTFRSIGGVPVLRFEDIDTMLESHAGQAVPIVLAMDGKERTIVMTPEVREIPQRIGFPRHELKIGIFHKKRTGAGTNAISEFLHFPPSIAIPHAIEATGQVIVAPVTSLWHRLNDRPVAMVMPVAPPPVFTGNMSDVTSSSEMVRAIAKYSWADVFYFTAFASANFGLFNLMPFPPLDGWNIVMAILEKAIRRFRIRRKAMNV